MNAGSYAPPQSSSNRTDASAIRVRNRFVTNLHGRGTPILALPSPTVFGRNWRSDQDKIAPFPDAEVIDEDKFPHNTGKIGLPKNTPPPGTNRNSCDGMHFMTVSCIEYPIPDIKGE
jgi:hypothetical protein